MATKVRVKQTVKTRTRVKKHGSSSAGYKVCPNCGGDGVVRKRK